MNEGEGGPYRGRREIHTEFWLGNLNKGEHLQVRVYTGSWNTPELLKW